MKFQQIVEFLVGFFGLGYSVWFFTMKNPKFDFSSAAGIAVFIFELALLNYFMFLFGKNTKKFPGFLINTIPARDSFNLESYFFKGLFLFGAAVSLAMIFIALYYSIIPGLLWLWSGN